MHEDVFAGLRGDEAKALLGVEPLHGSSSHVLVPPSIVLEVSTNAGPTLVPTARDKLDLRVAKENVNLCRATVAGAATARYRTRGSEMPLRGRWLRWSPQFLRSSCFWGAFPGPQYLEGGV